jgi:transposase-like protein
MIEQDHRRIKQRLRPMLGLKSFGNVRIPTKAITIPI